MQNQQLIFGPLGLISDTKIERPAMINYFSFLQIGPLLTTVVLPLRLLLGLFLAVVVFRNGKRREALEYRIPPIIWSGIVLVDPVLGLIAYWLVNRDAPYRELIDEPDLS